MQYVPTNICTCTCVYIIVHNMAILVLSADFIFKGIYICYIVLLFSILRAYAASIAIFTASFN